MQTRTEWMHLPLPPALLLLLMLSSSIQIQSQIHRQQRVQV
jgi:hypothetical protein